MKKLLLITLALLAAASLHADTISFTDSVVMDNGIDAVITLSKFDESLGTLTGVYLKYLTAIYGAEVEMDNDSTLAQQGTARVLNVVDEFESELLQDVVAGLDLQINAYQVFDLSPTTGDELGVLNDTGLAGDYALWDPGTLEGVGEGDLNAFYIPLYIGPGAYDVTVKSTYVTTATFNGSDGEFAGSTPHGQFIGEVTYTYTPIPEPATIGLLCIGCVLTLATSRIRRNRAA